jgi:hypothetical protein
MSTIPPLLPPPRRPPDWIERNWKWVLPVAVGLFAVLVAIFVAGVFTLLRHSEPYQLGLETVRNSPVAREILGDPIEEGWWLSGHIKWRNADGIAEFDVPISGSKARGRVHIQAHTELGRWLLEPVVLQEDADGRETRLLPATAAKPSVPL